MLRKNLVFSLVGQALTVLVMLICTRLIYRSFGEEFLGLLSFATAFTFLLIVLSDMGFTPLLVREVASSQADDPEYAVTLISSIQTIGWIAFLIAVIVTLLALPWIFDGWLQKSSAYNADVTLAFLFISVSLLIAIPRAIYGSVINAYHRADIWNVLTLMASLVQQLGLLFPILNGATVLEFSFCHLALSVLTLLPFVAYAVKLAGWRILGLRINTAVLKRNLAFGMKLLGNSLSGYFIAQIDRWMISRFLPIGQLAFYSFSQSLTSKGGMFPNAVVGASFSLLTERMGNVAANDWRESYWKLQDLISFGLVPVTAATVLIGSVVTGLVFTEEIRVGMWPVLVILGIGQLLQGSLYLLSWIAIAQRDPGIALKSNVGAMCFVLPVSALLCYYYDLIGAAAGSVLLGLWQFAFLLPRICRTWLAMDVSTWLLRFSRFLLPGLLCYFLPWLIGQGIGWASSPVFLSAVFIVGSAMYLFSSIYLLDAESRKIVRAMLRFR
jgi:O-antigen/teichoic acid export membrane protein